MYGTDNTNLPTWTDTTANVADWLDATNLELPDWKDLHFGRSHHDWSWKRPDNQPGRELTQTMTGKVADALLSGHGVGHCPDHCDLRLNISASKWGPCTTCWTAIMKVNDTGQVQIRTAMPIREVTSTVNTGCVDLLKQGLYIVSGHSEFAQWESIHLPAFADAFTDGTCPAGCPELHRPLCSKQICVRPTCEDAAQHCDDFSEAGIRARQYCPATCGMQTPTHQ